MIQNLAKTITAVVLTWGISSNACKVTDDINFYGFAEGQAILTVFEIIDGQLKISYTSTDTNTQEIYKGEIDIINFDENECKIEGTWTDKFGSGRSEFRIKNDLKSFEGTFTNFKDAPKIGFTGEWNGKVPELRKDML